MVLGDPRHAHQRTQSFHFALLHRHSARQTLDPAARALKRQAPCRRLYMHSTSLKHSTGSESERVDALGRRAVEVIICMITRDFSVISNDVTGVSLSLSLSLSQKSLTHNIGSASALPIISSTVTRPPSSIYARVNCSVIRDWCTRVQGHPRNLFRRPWNFGLSSPKHNTWPYHASVLWYTEANLSFQMQQRNFPRPYLRNDTMDFLFLTIEI